MIDFEYSSVIKGHHIYKDIFAIIGKTRFNKYPQIPQNFLSLELLYGHAKFTGRNPKFRRQGNPMKCAGKFTFLVYGIDISYTRKF